MPDHAAELEAAYQRAVARYPAGLCPTREVFAANWTYLKSFQKK